MLFIYNLKYRKETKMYGIDGMDEINFYLMISHDFNQWNFLDACMFVSRGMWFLPPCVLKD